MNWNGEIRVLEVKLHQPIPLLKQTLHCLYRLHLEMTLHHMEAEGFKVYHWPPRAVCFYLGTTNIELINPIPSFLTQEMAFFCSNFPTSSDMMDDLWGSKWD